MTTIGLCAKSLSPGADTTLAALGAAFGVSFEKRVLGDDRNISGWVVLDADRDLVSRVDSMRRPCYVVLDRSGLVPCGTSSKISCTNRPSLAPILRGRDVESEDAVTAEALPPWLEGVESLAFKDGAAVWGVQNRGAIQHQYVSLQLPELDEGEALFAHFIGQRFARLLPLVLFVRSLSVRDEWEQPPLQAAMMFDDPNLHWPSYGFIDYREMARHATTWNYHVSMATIPLDAWFVHAPTSTIFRDHASRLSLLCHGNDHFANELGRSRSRPAMRALLHQALQRIARLEARSGLEVARVMAPPHGACSEVALAEMARAGFEAVCVSRGSLAYHNAGAGWVRTIGMNPCDDVAGLPIIPRFSLSGSCRNQILVAALLDQPIVPIAHHQAVADGYDLLNQTASFVNSLGSVTWHNMKAIARSLYAKKQDGGILMVRMMSRHVTVHVPDGTTAIYVEPRQHQDRPEEKLFWRTTSNDRRWRIVMPSGTIASDGATAIEIRSRPVAVAGETVKVPRDRLRPVARRILTEGRDRAWPLFSGLQGAAGRVVWPGSHRRPTSE